MIADLGKLQTFFMIALLSTARMFACLTVLPFLGGNLLPQYIRNAIVFALFVVVYPLVASLAPQEIPTERGILLLLKEVFIGLVIGFLVSLVFWSAEMLGFLVDNQRGASMASAVDPLYGESTSPTGVILLQFVTVLFFATGGFLVFLAGVFESYVLWPVFSFFPPLDMGFSDFFLGKVDELMRTAVLLAAPFLIAIFLVDFSLGIVNRFTPQLNVFFLSMPIKSGVASFLLVLYLATIVAYYVKSWDLDRMLATIRVWVP